MKANHRILRLSTASLLASTALVAAPAIAQETSDSEEAEDTIIVTGIRAAIENATNNKKNADQIKDVIDAEDIGKLPDTNVAEALQRITGVQINRELGEGSEIAVRGFSQNRIEINGQTQLGGSSDGSVQFTDITSEAFKSIEVIKTPTASDVEGALGAIVRFNTRKPLDRKRDVFSINADAQYAERADAWSKNANMFASKQWDVGDGGRFGINANLTYKTRKLRQDMFFTRGWLPVSNSGFDLDGDGVANEPFVRDPVTSVITDLGDAIYLPQQTILRLREQDRELWSGTVGLQYQPNDELNFYVDARYTDNRSKDEQYQYNQAFNTMLAPQGRNARLRGGMFSQPGDIVVTENQTFVSGLLGSVNGAGNAARGVNLVFLNSTNPFANKIFTINGGVDWQMTDRLEAKVNYAYGKGSLDNDQAFITSVINFSEWPFYYADFGTGSDIPTLVPLVRTDPTTGLAPTEFRDDLRLDPLDLSSYSVAQSDFFNQRQDNNEKTFRLDFEWDADWGFIKSIEFGTRFSSLRGMRNRLAEQDFQNSTADGDLSGSTFADVEARFPGIVIQMPYTDVLNGASGDFVRQWFALSSEYLRLNLDQIAADANIVRTLDENWGYDVTRDTKAAYLKANYGFDLGAVNFYGNFGMRYAHTDQVATGGIDTGNNSFESFTFTQKYDNWLPSMNLIGDFGNGYFARFGAAKVLSRPNLTSVAPQIDANIVQQTGFGGNPTLRPERVTQFDLSLEKYYGKSNLISLAFFYKDFSERIEAGILPFCISLPPGEVGDPGDSCDDSDPSNQQIEVLLNTQVNEGATKVKGFEAGWQQSLDFLPGPLSGLGLIANYTFVDSGEGSISGSGRSLPPQKLSRHSYNLIGYYEKYGFSARVAYNWRSKFFDSQTGFQEGEIKEGYGQLDASMGYDFTKKLSIQLEAINILNAPERSYQEIRERVTSYAVNDRRFLIGVRWRM